LPELELRELELKLELRVPELRLEDDEERDEE
jgi:hypothetical protein